MAIECFLVDGHLDALELLQLSINIKNHRNYY